MNHLFCNTKASQLYNRRKQFIHFVFWLHDPTNPKKEITSLLAKQQLSAYNHFWLCHRHIHHSTNHLLLFKRQIKLRSVLICGTFYHLPNLLTIHAKVIIPAHFDEKKPKSLTHLNHQPRHSYCYHPISKPVSHVRAPRTTPPWIGLFMESVSTPSMRRVEFSLFILRSNLHCSHLHYSPHS